jgi:hypothetical protein
MQRNTHEAGGRACRSQFKKISFAKVLHALLLIGWMIFASRSDKLIQSERYQNASGSERSTVVKTIGPALWFSPRGPSQIRALWDAS